VRLVFALSGATARGNQNRVWCNRPVQDEPQPALDAPIAAIGGIVAGGEGGEGGTLVSSARGNSHYVYKPLANALAARGPRLLRRVSVIVPALGLLGAVLFVASEASAERVSLLGFEGDSARALRWRVASALKRAGHTVVGSAPPKDPEDRAQLRAYATKRRVDVFVAGSSVRENDGWELSLTFMDAEGEAVGRGVTFSADDLRGIIREVKEQGPDRLDGAVRGGGSGSAGRDDDDGGAAADFAGQERARTKKKGAAGKRSREVEEPIADEEESDSEAAAPSPRTRAKDDDANETTFDADEADDSAGGEAESETKAERESGARGWSKTDSEPSEDDGRASFLTGDGEGDGESSGESVGEDEGGSEDGSSTTASDDPTVRLGLNAGFVRRTLGYSDDLYSRLRAPSANAWVYRLRAAVYPFARPVKNRIGLIAAYEAEFSGVVRDNAAGTDFGVTYSDLYGGIELRQPLGNHELALEGTIGSMKSGLDDPQGQSGVPEYSYTSVRAALDARLHFGSVSLTGSVGYRLPIGGYGEVSEVDWFPRMSGFGVEASAGLAYRISKEVAFEGSGSVRRFLLQMNSVPEDAMGGVSEVAGGAVDLYLSGYFGLVVTL
jgi:hypothetical protein